MLEFEVKTPPEFELFVENETATVEVMGGAILVALKARLASGLGARDALDRPKAGGKALHSTGTLAASIAVEVVQRRGHPVALIKPTGDRPASENAGEKAKRAAAKTKTLRAAKTMALRMAASQGEKIDSHWMRKKPTKSGETFKVGSIKVRAATTNAALAGILSVAPKDKRGIAGGRGVYRVFVGSNNYQRIATDAAKTIVKFGLRVKDT